MPLSIIFSGGIPRINSANPKLNYAQNLPKICPTSPEIFLKKLSRNTCVRSAINPHPLQ